MNDVLFNVLLSVSILTISIVARFLIPSVSNWLKNSKYQTAYFWVEKAVKAAEKIYSYASGLGVLKKQYVVDFINKINIKLKLKLTNEQIEILIESCCEELVNKNNITEAEAAATLNTEKSDL